MFQEFLSEVLAPEGYLCLFFKQDSRRFNKLFSIQQWDDACFHITHYSNSGYDVYFSPTSFATPVNREAVNALSSRAFFVDLDVGQEPRKYPTKVAALQALQVLVDTLGLPVPTWVVDSGNGLHVYWILDTVLPADQWRARSGQFKMLLLQQHQYGFLFDATVPGDIARVLRIPGTYNYKDPSNPKTVKVLHRGAVVATQNFFRVLDPMVAPTLQVSPVATPAATNDLTAGLAGTYKPAKFSIIYGLFNTPRECRQLKQCVTDRATLSEPMWRAALSIADKCIDRVQAIETVSLDHPDYSFAVANAKAAATTGPHSCQQFNAHNPGICVGCPHWGKITSPISLGVFNTVEELALPITTYTNPVEYILRNEIPASSTVGILPFPYYRTTAGIYKELTPPEITKALKAGTTLTPSPKDPTGDPTCIKVFDYDFAVTAVGYDSDANEEVYGLSVKMPRDPIRTQTMTSTHLKGLDKFRTALHMGAGIADYEINNIRDLVIRSVKTFRNQSRASDVIKQMGWSQRNTFCFGQYEIHKDGTITTVINRPEVRPIMGAIRVEGDTTVCIDAFKRASAFWSSEGYEYGAMALATTFASPLLHIGGVINGGIIHCYSPLSGRGKSALQLTCLSAWGDSTQLMALPSDTVNSTMHHINMLGSLPLAIEEITKQGVEETGVMIYQLTHGREKRRMDGATYTNKPTMGNYRTLTITSGNASLLDKALAGTSAPDGLVYRILELKMDNPLPTNFAIEELLLTLSKNFGSVGAIYITYIVMHQDIIKRMVRDTVAAIEADWQMQKHERYWREIIAYMLVGMRVANDLNIAAFDMAAVTRWMKSWFLSYRSHVLSLLSRARDLLTVIVAKYTRDTVFVGVNNMAVIAAGGAGLLRYESVPRELWISAAVLQRESVAMGVDIGALTDAMTSAAFKYLGARSIMPAAGLTGGMVVGSVQDGHMYHVLTPDKLPPEFMNQPTAEEQP